MYCLCQLVYVLFESASLCKLSCIILCSSLATWLVSDTGLLCCVLCCGLGCGLGCVLCCGLGCGLGGDVVTHKISASVLPGKNGVGLNYLL